MPRGGMNANARRVVEVLDHLRLLGASRLFGGFLFRLLSRFVCGLLFGLGGGLVRRFVFLLLSILGEANHTEAQHQRGGGQAEIQTAHAHSNFRHGIGITEATVHREQRS